MWWRLIAGAFIALASVTAMAEETVKFGAGDITDDDLLNNMGDVALGIETAYFYSAAHPSEKNKAFVEGMKRANNGMRANFFGVSGYDGMHLIYEAIRKTGGKTDGDSFIGAVKGMSWESPRGPMTIDPETRDVINNIYMRRVERVNGELWNIEFATVENVKDPVKAVSRRVPFLGSAERTSPGASRPGEPRRGQPHWGVPQGGVDVEREAQRGGPRWGEPQGRPAFIPWTSPGRTSGGRTSVGRE
jgi:Periplasmic binding protein